jgi:hypothetical protein
LSPLTSVGARGSSKKAPVVDLSSYSDEGDLITDVSRDEAFTRRLFADLNRDVLVSSRDGKIIILSDSNEEKEVREEKAIDVKVAPSSVVRSLTSIASADDADGTYKSNTPDQATSVAAAVETKLACLRLPHQGGACRKACLKENFKGYALLHHKYFCKEEW